MDAVANYNEVFDGCIKWIPRTDQVGLMAASMCFIRRLYLYFLSMDEIFLSMDKTFLSMDKNLFIHGWNFHQSDFGSKFYASCFQMRPWSKIWLTKIPSMDKKILSMNKKVLSMDKIVRIKTKDKAHGRSLHLLWPTNFSLKVHCKYFSCKISRLLCFLF